jgi:hypothetical protein
MKYIFRERRDTEGIVAKKGMLVFAAGLTGVLADLWVDGNRTPQHRVRLAPDY